MTNTREIVFMCKCAMILSLYIYTQYIFCLYMISVYKMVVS